ncbi:hypothetical protein MUK42_25187 [Musa troglodytarum]|uniref:Aspergillus nuclease S1 n=1 Tax=Musa troglodytarum TaxID=320322 RepID=A0A9E7I6P8_9LILI|nr:hypothetical protein MUK42_25187 [Musa troglodytarum]
MGLKFCAPASLFLLLSLPAFAYGWGVDGHAIICQIAQERLSESAAAAVEDLLPNYAKNNLSSLCTWADRVKFRYRWSSPLHYIDTPDGLCTYDYDRDCKDEDGVKGRCVSGGITNYTNQLLDYGNSSSESQYNLTEALLFLAHLMGDVHQVWDDNIVETAEERFYDDNVEEFTEAIKQNITGEWSDQVVKWEKCSNNKVACPDVYASESIEAACDWAYKDVKNNTQLEDRYFLSRLPVVNLRLAEGGVRLAATLNRIFG